IDEKKSEVLRFGWFFLPAIPKKLHFYGATYGSRGCLFYRCTAKQRVNRLFHILFLYRRSVLIVVVYRPDIAHHISLCRFLQHIHVWGFGGSVLRIDVLPFVQQIRKGKAFVLSPALHGFIAVAGT